ncbi:ATP-binding cassette transporter [Coprinopsis cinerea AmutBmut pab1-1]|nr:ATP-binding cassette transporter [Coprinopsis cinerea AmutBmut pab1-1]
MVRYQMKIEIFLLVSALTSAIRLYRGKRDVGAGKIRLEDDDDLKNDPFDVTTPEDTIDGFPIGEQDFWRRMRRRKMVVAILLALATALDAAAVGYTVTSDDGQKLLSAILHLLLSLYALALSAGASWTDDAETHCEPILHLAVLSGLAALSLLFTAILSEPDRHNTPEDSVMHLLWYSAVGLYALVCALASTIQTGPPLNHRPELLYSAKTVRSITNTDQENVCGSIGSSLWGTLVFSYTTKVVWLGNLASSFEIGDLPIIPARLRAVYNYSRMKDGMGRFAFSVLGWKPRPGSGWDLGYKLARLNSAALIIQLSISAATAILFYAPALFMRHLISYLEGDPAREDRGWGWAYAFGLFTANAVVFIISAQLWFFVTTRIEIPLGIQLNTILFAKTLVRKDVTSGSENAIIGEERENEDIAEPSPSNDSEGNASSKARVMNLMTMDVNSISGAAWTLFTLVDSPVQIVVGTYFLHTLLGVSCFYGLAVICLLLPLNHIAGKTFVGVREKLTNARDERVTLTNEILGAIRTLKFMAWERHFEKRVLSIRERELMYQKQHFWIETFWNAVWSGSPLLVTLVAFWHFAVVRQQPLTPSIAFTSIIVFSDMKYALNGLPQTLINILSCLVSLRRIEEYLNGVEIDRVPPREEQTTEIGFFSCSVTWPEAQCQSNVSYSTPSPSATLRSKFMLTDLTLKFPPGELSLICGKLGSGKTLLLLALLGEADVIHGKVLCPRSPPGSIASWSMVDWSKEEWVTEGMCAYVPQVAWLRNASIKENILFGLPYHEERYQKTLEVCALVSDLGTLEDGDNSEIGERGVNLSGGQKARVSLARAVYSRASILFFDDVLSAVDAHTAHHIYHRCLRGELMKGRIVILVSHHVQLCATRAVYIVALDNGHVMFEGSRDAFIASGAMSKLGQTGSETGLESDVVEKKQLVEVEDDILGQGERSDSETFLSTARKEKQSPHQLVEDEKREVGRIKKDVWITLFRACGSDWFWVSFGLVFGLAALVPVVENNWLRYWSASALEGSGENPSFISASTPP